MPDAVHERPPALIYKVCFSPARPAPVAMSRKLGVNVPWASLLCWSEQRQSCELERGSSSIADNPCLVTESTLSTAQGGYDPAHTLFFYEFAHVEYASGCYVLGPQSDGTLQEDHEGNIPMGFVTAAPKCSKLSPGARNAQHAWFPHEPTHACRPGKTVWGPDKPGPRPVIFCSVPRLDGRLGA